MTQVLVTGGTGQIGVFLLPRLLAAGFRVTALSRRIPVGDKRQPNAGDGRLTWMHPETFGALGSEAPRSAEFVEILVSAGPIVAALDLLALSPRVRRVVCFSSSSVLVKGSSPEPAERAQVQSIIAAERALKGICAARSISLCLFRPTLIYGCGLDRNVSLIAYLGQRFRVLPIAGRAQGLRQPVHAEDLAELAVCAVGHEPPVELECAVAGGETLTYRDMVERVFAAFGLRPRLIAIPPVALAVAAGIAGRLFRLDSLNAEVVRRQNRDLVFDDRSVREQLRHEPRAFRPTAADFATPTDAAALQP